MTTHQSELSYPDPKQTFSDLEDQDFWTDSPSPTGSIAAETSVLLAQVSLAGVRLSKLRKSQGGSKVVAWR